MKRFIAFVAAGICVSFALVPRVTGSQTKKESAVRYAPGQILVKLKADARPNAVAGSVDAAQLAQSILLEQATGAESLAVDVATEDTGLYLMRLDQGLSVDDAIRRASADPRVEYAEPDYLIYPSLTPNDARFEEMWGLLNDGSSFGKVGADIGATSAWDLTTGSDDVVVAIADSGVDLNHPDLAANAWVNPREIPGNGIDDDGNGLIDDVNGWNFLANSNQLVEDFSTDFHGTHVAGTVGAVGNNGTGTTGVAWHVKLMSVKFLGSTPGTTSNAIKCIKYASDERRHGVNVRVINASWGGAGNSQSLHDAIVEAGDLGILFVCAAGNGGSDSRGDDLDEDPDYPAAWAADTSSVISVSALDRSDSLPGFSNYGHTAATVAAPGVSILSTTPFGGYGGSSGTSMSTPHVTGIAALLAAFSPSLTPSQIKERIIRTAVPVLSVASKTVASGRANAFNALTNHVVPPGSPAIASIRTNKKFVFVDGLNFANGSCVIEVNGVALRKNKYNDDFVLANGTLTEVKAKLGKSGVISTFPQFTQVMVTVFNPETGERSAAVGFTRL